jgi:hypothetical protein
MGPSCIAVIQKQKLIDRRHEIVEVSDAQLLVVTPAAPQPKTNPTHLPFNCNINHAPLSLSACEFTDDFEDHNICSCFYS